MTNDTQAGSNFLYDETSAENFIKPTMNIYEALRWIAFGLPPLKTPALEDMFLYDDVLACREEKAGPIPELASFKMFYDEEAELKKALVMGRLGARGLDDADIACDGEWGPSEKDLIDIDQTFWELFEGWNYQQPYSRVNFGFCGWYGHVQFKTDAVIALFPISSRVHRDCVSAENDIYQCTTVTEEKEERKKPGRKPNIPKDEMYKAIAICALAGKIDTDMSEDAASAAVFDLLEKSGISNIPKADTIGRDYLRKLRKDARIKSGKMPAESISPEE
ncbi:MULTISPECIES: hypothetical protein [Thalassospira]|uniref:Uncharacterized protein n=2 Tax=Thalassospira TaxID=168934 RepID=A0A367WBV3_9PROT|nr:MULTISPECIES: hypothetical protein [Thalassospira]MDG4717795.1 hypothetical protein [Thalassospira sp. FZY0004]RCK38749.1 hypothetical protein TH19_02790 [Thalassospira profundimaris]